MFYNSLLLFGCIKGGIFFFKCAPASSTKIFSVLFRRRNNVAMLEIFLVNGADAFMKSLHHANSITKSLQLDLSVSLTLPFIQENHSK